MTGPVTRIALSSILVAAALAYIGMAAVQRANVPDEASWEQAASTVRAGWKEGDLVVFWPAWAHAGAAGFQGLAVDIAELPDWYEASKHPRVWVVASPSGKEPELPGGWHAVSRTEAGRITVHMWTPGELVLAWDGLQSLKDAKVSRGDGEKRQGCSTWQDGKWHCGAQHPWQNVGRISRDIAGRVRDVIWAHARDNSEPLEIRWAGVSAGRTLTVNVGLTQRAIEQVTGSPVEFEVRVGDRVEISRSIDINEAGWFRYDIDVSNLGPVDVTVRIVAKKNQDRQLCFTADMWR